MDKLFSDFGVNWTSIIFYTINFFILLFLLNRFLFKPVNKIIDERKKMSEEIVDNLERSRKDMENLEVKIQENLKESNKQAQSIIENAKVSASKIVDESSQEAKEKADKILNTAAKVILERQKTMEKEIKEHTLDQVKKLFSIVMKSVPKDEQEKLVKDSLEKYE